MTLFMDAFRIDNHKLMYHVSRVNQWLSGDNIYPIYIEISPSGTCNQRCSFCALDYLSYKTQFIDKDVLKNVLSEISGYGVKSVMFAGEGEPFLHKDIAELILHTRKVGIDVATTTNAVLFIDDIAEKCLPVLSWMRVSLNAGTPEGYSKIHRCSSDVFGKVLDNIVYAVELKRKNHYFCTIGVQLLLLPDNYKEVTILAKRLKDISVDYLIIKPYSQHPKSKNRINAILDYSDLARKLEKLSDNDFKVIFRKHAFKKIGEKKHYDRCLGLPFWTYIDSGGDIYACSTFLGDDKFCYGNIYKNSFKEIWTGAKRKKILNMFANEFNIAQCRRACRLGEINRYLWELKNPHPHVNFI